MNRVMYPSFGVSRHGVMSTHNGKNISASCNVLIDDIDVDGTSIRLDVDVRGVQACTPPMRVSLFIIKGIYL